MRKHYDELQDTLSWEVLTGAGEYAGLSSYAAAVEIPGRKQEEVVTFTEDRVSQITFTLRPQDEPNVGDKLDGAEVIEKAVAKDVRGKVHRWIAYAKK